MSNETEITHVAVVQRSGLVSDGAVISRGFGSRDEAIAWVTEEVQSAHGGDVSILSHEHDTKYDRVTTTDGPTNGLVFEV